MTLKNLVREILKKSILHNKIQLVVDMKIGIILAMIVLLFAPITAGSEDILYAGQIDTIGFLKFDSGEQVPYYGGMDSGEPGFIKVTIVLLSTQKGLGHDIDVWASCDLPFVVESQKQSFYIQTIEPYADLYRGTLTMDIKINAFVNEPTERRCDIYAQAKDNPELFIKASVPVKVYPTTPSPTPTPISTSTPKPEEGVPGFETGFTIVSLLAVAYKLWQKR